MPVTLQPTSLKYRNSSEDEWQEASAIKGSDGEGVPAGGQTGQELKKASDNDFDTEWVDDTSVSYMPQSLADNKKATARTNIGAASKSEFDALAAIENAPPIHTQSESDRFEDGADGHSIAYTLHVVAQQAGSGTPSASNIREITGYQEGNIWRWNGENRTPLSSDPFAGSITTAAKYVVFSPFQSVDEYKIPRFELTAWKDYRLEFDLEVTGTTEVNSPSIHAGNSLPVNGSGAISKTTNVKSGHYTIRFRPSTQELSNGKVFSFCPLNYRNNVQNVQFTISNLTLIESESLYFDIPEDAQDVYGEHMSMDQNFHLITVEDKAFFGGVFTIDADGNTVLTKTHKCIRSYNGETLPGAWISDRDEYVPGTTPTTGAFVVYELAEADRETFVRQNHQITSLLGANVLSSDIGTVSVDQYTADTKTYIDNAFNNIAQVATAEEVAEIITSYEEDEDMIFETEFESLGHGEGRYTSVDTTETIVNAYTSGKHVILHFPADEDFGISEAWVSVTGVNVDAGYMYFAAYINGEYLEQLSIEGEHITLSV